MVSVATSGDRKAVQTNNAFPRMKAAMNSNRRIEELRTKYLRDKVKRFRNKMKDIKDNNNKKRRNMMNSIGRDNVDESEKYEV